MGPEAARKRGARPGGGNRCMRRSRWRVGWCELSARLFKYRAADAPHLGESPASRHYSFGSETELPAATIHSRCIPVNVHPPGRYTAGDGEHQPTIETVGLALAHDPTKVLSELDCHRHVAGLGLEVGHELHALVGPLPRPLQHQPGRATRGQWLVPPLHDPREGMARALRAWRQPLRLMEPPRIACHRWVAAGVAVASKIPKEL
jgi:hypothetical protein